MQAFFQKRRRFLLILFLMIIVTIVFICYVIEITAPNHDIQKMVSSAINGNSYTKVNASQLQRIKDNFLSHLSEYGLILINISNKSNEFNTYNHPQYNDGYLLHQINSSSSLYILFELNLCVGSDMGLGNILSKYWGAFAISFFLNYNFKWSLCGTKSKLASYDSKQQYFSSFLPKYYENNKTSNGNYLMILANRNKYHTSYIHTCSLAFLYYNKYIAPYTINKIYDKAIISYYKFNNKPILSINTNSDIVIHYRCGNIIHLSPSLNPRYGLLTTNYIKYSVNNVYNKSDITSNTSIYIISQLSKNSLRPHERKSMTDCNYLINYIVNNSLSSFFKPARIKIVYNSDINDDYYRMINAKLLICSPSSFCFMAAIANKNGFVIMPSYGPWINFNDITNITKNYSDYYSNDLIAKHSKLLPHNHIIIDTLKTGWHINQYADYGENKYNLKKLSLFLANN